MSGYKETKIGRTTFLVFANGMVPANDVARLIRKGDRFEVMLRRSGLVEWFEAVPSSDPIEPETS